MHRKIAQLCVYSSAARVTARPTAHGRRARGGASVMIAFPNTPQANTASSAHSAYMRASWAYSVRNGLVAASTAAIQPARVPNSARAAHQATGMHSSAHVSESTRAASSDVPATRIQTCRSR